MDLPEIELRLAVIREEAASETAALLRLARSKCKHGEWMRWLRKAGINRRTAHLYITQGEPVVYFVQRDNLVKVGRTFFLDRRMDQLRSEHGDIQLLGTLPGYAIEYKLHQELEPFHVDGEWFELTPDQARAILERHRS